MGEAHAPDFAKAREGGRVIVRDCIKAIEQVTGGRVHLPDLANLHNMMDGLFDEAFRAGQAAALSQPAVETDAQEAEWFRWLRDNPQAAAYIAVLVAKNRPHGPDLGASMASGEAVGVMEDAKQPEYRFAATPPAPDGEREDSQDADDRDHEDCATLDDVVREVFCRVFGDDGDAGLAEMERWRAWYKPSDWIWWGRGLGTFLELRVKERAMSVSAGAERKEGA